MKMHKAHAGDTVFLEVDRRLTNSDKASYGIAARLVEEETGVTVVLLDYGVKATVRRAVHPLSYTLLSLALILHLISHLLSGLAR